MILKIRCVKYCNMHVLPVAENKSWPMKTLLRRLTPLHTSSTKSNIALP